jgi:EAL domain-containing protein (putative c-di-GMP-specific phosphodiesterase class I)
METACRQNKRWQDMGIPLRMAVNLSLEQFRSPKLVKMVDQTLRMTGLDPGCLELELTKSIAVKEAVYIISILNNLKKLGVMIALDDFGTEYPP